MCSSEHANTIHGVLYCSFLQLTNNLSLNILVFISRQTYVSSSLSIPTSNRLIEVRISSALATSHMSPFSVAFIGIINDMLNASA